MRYALPFLLVLILGLSSCSFTCLPGEGEVITQEVDLDLIDAINAASVVPVDIRFGQNQKVTFTGHANHLALMNKVVNRGEWEIEFDEHICSDDIRIELTLPSITRIEVSGTGDVRTLSPFHEESIDIDLSGTGDLDADINVELVDVDMSGTGDLVMKGFAEEMNVDNSGTGNLRSIELKCKEVFLDGSGTGDMHVYASEEIEVDLGGTGSVFYHGNPGEVSSELSGTGDVLKQ